VHEQNSSVAGLMITQSSGDTGYILHNRANTLTIGAGSIDRITIDREGNIGFGTDRPTYPVHMASGAYVSAGGVWTNSSSRERKDNIEMLTVEDAIAALAQLEPVQFNYRNDTAETYIGFIAEDVPELVATADRKSLSTMDIVAVLTKVIQAQQVQIDALEQRLNNSPNPKNQGAD
jgi:cation diffusion facilitator CzcD-associated flavoprotein CzcO